MKRFPLVSFAENRPSAHVEFNPFCVSPLQVIQNGNVHYPVNSAAFDHPDKTDFVAQENFAGQVADGLRSLASAMDAAAAPDDAKPSVE